MPTDQTTHPPDPPPRHDLPKWCELAATMHQLTDQPFDEWMLAKRLISSWDEALAEIVDLTGASLVKQTLMNWYPELKSEHIQAKRKEAARLYQAQAQTGGQP